MSDRKNMVAVGNDAGEHEVVGAVQEVVWFRHGIWKVDCVCSWQVSGQSCCSKVRSMGPQQQQFWPESIDVNMAKRI